MSNQFDNNFNEWINQKRQAIELSTICANLEIDKKTDLVLLRRRLGDKNVTEIINLHERANNMLGLRLEVATTLNIAKEIEKLDIAPSRIDLLRLCKEWELEKSNFGSMEEFVKSKLSAHLGSDKMNIEPKDVVLFGFGRIGRLVARMIVEEPGNQLRLKAIVIRMKNPEEIEKRAYLLKKDSIHGEMKGTVAFDIEEGMLIVNGQRIKIITSATHNNIDYTAYGIQNALLIDSTGAFRTEEQLSEHLQSKGISKVLLTAPGKGNLPNIVYGVNHLEFDPKKVNVFTAASCTTNAVVPILKVVYENFGISSGHIETVHAYTNDQNLTDNFHKASRRGRSAPMNMVITETGAASAAVKALPYLKGKLTANSVRVPIPNVSLAILALRLDKETSLENINNTIRDASFSGDLMEQIDYSVSKELVSTDVVGNTHALEYDSKATIINEDKKGITLYAWYDNEYGYTCQVMRLAKYIAGVLRMTYY
jgi:glyceraldehyde 3-phosphate dehydrogenase